MTGLGDDLYYVEHSANSAELRYVFRQIFEHMGQEQHYNMMTRGSTDFKAPPSQVGAQQTTIRTI